MLTILFWLLFIASVIHIIEESFGDAVGWLSVILRSKFDSAEFNTINIIYISLNFLAAVIGANDLLISLSIASIAFLNILIHTLGAVFARRYSPGTVSALGLFLPLVVAIYSDIDRNNIPHPSYWIVLACGLLVMGSTMLAARILNKLLRSKN